MDREKFQKELRGHGYTLSSDADNGRGGLVLEGKSGQGAVWVAEELADMKKSRASRRGRSAVTRVAGKTFVLWRGVWVDQTFDAKAKQVRIEYLGETYLNVFAAMPKWKAVFALGENLIVVTPSGTVLVVTSKLDKEKPLSDEQIKALFVPAP